MAAFNPQKRLYLIAKSIRTMAFDFNSLGELLRREKSSSALQPVEETLYKDMQRLLREAEETYRPYSKEQENIRNLVTDIFNAREKKLVLFAVSFARSAGDVDAENATKDESEFLKTLVSSLRDRRDALLKKDAETEKTSEKVKSSQKKSTAADKGARHALVIRMLQDMPPIVGSDSRTYGAFKAEDVVMLPEKNARLFIKQGYGEPISPPN